jgi:ABC-2 type transport system permease protein
MELLLTMPITSWQAIVGKFLASWLFLIIALALTFPVVITVCYLGDADLGEIFTRYVGSALLAGGYLAVTSMTSAMTRNQVISFILSVVNCYFKLLSGFEPVTDLLPNSLVGIVTGLSSLTHFIGFQKGVIDSRDLIYFGSLVRFALFLTGVIIRNLRAG